MRYLICLILFNCAFFPLNAQFLTPLEFDNYEPLWSHYSFVPSLDDSQQGFEIGFVGDDL